MPDVALTWLGHDAFSLRHAPAGNASTSIPSSTIPTCPESRSEPERVDLIAS